MPQLYKHPQLQLIFGITLMVVLGVSSIIPVLPSLMQEFELTPAKLSLVLAVFTLPGVLIAPVSGVLADRFGRKAVIVPSLTVFGIFGMACAFATDYPTLLALRFLQGVGAAALGVMAVTIIGDIFTKNELPEAMGLNMSVLSVGTALYPAIGGALGMLGWRATFALPVVALPLAWAVYRRLEASHAQQQGDFKSYLRGAAKHMKTRSILGLFGLIFIVFILLYGPVVTFFPILLSDRFAASPFEIGMLMASASVTMALASSQLGRLTRIFREHLLFYAGSALYMACFVLVLNMDGKWWFILPMGVFGLAQGLTIPTAVTLLNRITPQEYRGATMSAHGTLLRLGQTVGPPLLGAVHVLGGMSGVFIFGVLLAVAMAAVAVGCLRLPPASGDDSGETSGVSPHAQAESPGE